MNIPPSMKINKDFCFSRNEYLLRKPHVFPLSIFHRRRLSIHNNNNNFLCKQFYTRTQTLDFMCNFGYVFYYHFFESLWKYFKDGIFHLLLCCINSLGNSLFLRRQPLMVSWFELIQTEGEITIVRILDTKIKPLHNISSSTPFCFILNNLYSWVMTFLESSTWFHLMLLERSW